MRLSTALAWIISTGILLSFAVTIGAILYQMLIWPPSTNAESAANFQINLQIMEVLGLYTVTGAIMVNIFLRRANHS